MMPKVGELAPDFSVKDFEGNTIQLSNLRGNKIVLYFYPKDDTPGCTKEACGFRDAFSEYEKAGIKIFGVSFDDDRSHKTFISKYQLPFTLLVDSDHKVSQMYGTYEEHAWNLKKLIGLGPARKTFLIDENGIIKHIFDKVDIGTHAQDILKIFSD